MSKWYKKSSLGNNLVFVITTWLRNSKNYVDFMNINDDINHQIKGADDSFLLNNAIQMASSVVAREQGGSLTEHQQQLISNLNTRIQDTYNNDSLDMPQIENQAESINNNEIQEDKIN